MSVWYELNPVDTLFFRGNEPMEAGLPAGTPLFPPPVSVLSGAFRTAILREKRIHFADYKAGTVDPAVLAAIGPCGGKAAFDVLAVAMKKGSDTYVSAPASIFVDVEHRPKDGRGYKDLTSHVAQPLANTGSLAPRSHAGGVPFVLTTHEPLGLAGSWIAARCLVNHPKSFGSDDILTAEDLYGVEDRIGIGLKPERVVQTGKLYSARHIRLRDGVSILVALSADPGLPAQGMFSLGGEQRRCGYRRLDAASQPRFVGPAVIKNYVSLVPMPATEALIDHLVCSSKLQVLAGWDLARGFHKETVSWIPAGAVFGTGIDASTKALCAAIDY